MNSVTGLVVFALSTDEAEARMVAEELWLKGYRQVSRAYRHIGRAHAPTHKMQTYADREYYRRTSKDIIQNVPEVIMRRIRELGDL